MKITKQEARQLFKEKTNRSQRTFYNWIKRAKLDEDGVDKEIFLKLLESKGKSPKVTKKDLMEQIAHNRLRIKRLETIILKEF